MSKYTVIPTRTAQMIVRPIFSLVLNLSASKNQLRAAVQMPIQRNPYQGPFIFFISCVVPNKRILREFHPEEEADALSP